MILIPANHLAEMDAQNKLGAQMSQVLKNKSMDQHQKLENYQEMLKKFLFLKQPHEEVSPNADNIKHINFQQPEQVKEETSTSFFPSSTIKEEEPKKKLFLKKLPPAKKDARKKKNIVTVRKKQKIVNRGYNTRQNPIWLSL